MSTTAGFASKQNFVLLETIFVGILCNQANVEKLHLQLQYIFIKPLHILNYVAQSYANSFRLSLMKSLILSVLF